MGDESNQEAVQDATANTAPKAKTVVISCRDPVHLYLHLRHVSSSTQPVSLDEMTVSMHLNAAMTQYLGLHGSAIPIDFLKLQDQDMWIRIPSDDRQGFVAALSSWTGRTSNAYRIIGWSSWDANAYSHDAGQELFTD